MHINHIIVHTASKPSKSTWFGIPNHKKIVLKESEFKQEDICNFHALYHCLWSNHTT